MYDGNKKKRKHHKNLKNVKNRFVEIIYGTKIVSTIFFDAYHKCDYDQKYSWRKK